MLGGLLTPDRLARVRSLAGDIALCSYARHFTLSVPLSTQVYLTIISRAQMGYESIAHEGESNNCFSKIQLVGQKDIETKHLSLDKARL